VVVVGVHPQTAAAAAGAPRQIQAAALASSQLHLLLHLLLLLRLLSFLCLTASLTHGHCSLGPSLHHPLLLLLQVLLVL
jgi:hypothetical protein